MYMKQDWLMRQIQMMTAAIAQLVLGKSGVEVDTKEASGLDRTDLINNELQLFIGQRRLREAEALLFRNLDPENQDRLRLALDFYEALNRLSDEDLEACRYPREEIDRGLHDVMDYYGLYLPGF